MRRSTQPKLSVFETARAGIVKTQAMMFFASALLQTKYVIDETCDTAWTDMVVIGYNPKFIERLSVAVAKFVILHELLHILLKHGLRRGSRDPAEWNICCDYAINIILRDMGVTLWEYALIDERYRGMSAEQIYAARQQERSKSRGKGPGQGRGQGQGSGQQPQPGQGQSQPGQQPTPTQGGLGGDLKPVPAITPDQIAAVEHEISKTIARATTIAKQYGVMPGALEAIVGATYEDPVPWEQVLIDYMSAVVNQRENWSHRNRRYSEVILPSHWSNGMDELTIVADSSGSCFSKPVFERVAVAVNHIVTVIKPMTVRVIWADDKDCQNIDVFEDGAEVILHPKGGGGTDMRKPLVYAEQYQPEVVLLLTDGYTPWPDVATPFPLIVGCTTDAPCPDWAGTVRIEVQ
jgi:predicted metal-dependent peptidase